MTQPKNLTSISLFSGAGGLDLGLEGQGFQTNVFVEIERAARETLKTNRYALSDPDATISSDIRELTPGGILEAANLRRGEVALVAGGPPCQSFSTAGKRGSISDPRGDLFHYFVDFVDGIRPRFFVMENVRGILSAALQHRPLSQRGNGHPPLARDEQLGGVLNRIVLPALRDRLGYQVVYGLVNSADYGVPQTRKRVLFMGSRDAEFGTEDQDETTISELLPPTHAREPKNGCEPWLTLADALSGLDEEAPEYSRYSRSRAAVLKLVPPGKNWRYLRDTRRPSYIKKIMGGAYSSGGGKVGFWRRLSFDRPCPTVPTSPIQKSTSLCHPIETRPLTVKEYARVQQFPDDYAFVGSVSERYRQIGNAVPVGLGQAIGKALRETMSQNTSTEPDSTTNASRLVRTA